MPTEIAPDQTFDPDDVEALRDDTRRENDALAREVRQTRTRRQLRQEAAGDQQDFRDQIEASLPTTTMDELQDASRETQELERLDVLEALRNLQTGDPIRWRIYRQGHENPDMNGYLAEWTTSQLTQERIKDEFGGGTYKIRGQHSDGKYAGGRTIHIAGDAIRKEKYVNSTQQPAINVAELITAQTARDEARRRDEDARAERERKAAEAKEEQRRRERNELLAIVVPALTGLTTAIVGAFAANRGPDLASLLAALKGPDPLVLLTQLKQLEDKPNHDGVLMKVLPMLLERASDSAREGDTGWLDVVKELAKSAGPAVGGLIEAAMSQARQNGTASSPGSVMPGMAVSVQGTAPNANIPLSAPAVAPPGMPPAGGLIVVPEPRPRRERPRRSASDPSGAGSPGSPPGMAGITPPGSAASIADGSSGGATPGGNNMNLFSLMQHLPWIKEQLARLGPAAARGKDPELYAALFLEELPEGITPETLGALLSREDWFHQLAQLDPRINSSALYPWFEALRGFILQSLHQEVAQPLAGVATPVAGPGAVAPISTVGAAPTRQRTGEVERPTKIPSLTGDTD